jgi:hypothetical protein
MDINHKVLTALSVEALTSFIVHHYLGTVITFSVLEVPGSMFAGPSAVLAEVLHDIPQSF